MKEIHDILLREEKNMDSIYLYEYNDRWYAFERSAYYFSMIFKLGACEWIDGHIGLAVDKQFNFLHSPGMSSLEVTSMGNTEITMICRKVPLFAGFEQWKINQGHS